MDGQDRDALFLFPLAADGGHIVADDAHDAGGVDESGLGPVTVDQFVQGGGQLFSPPKMTSFSRRSVEKLMRCSSGPDDKAPRISQV
jgi:hypothetical protein